MTAEMTEREVRLMTSQYASSWPGTLDDASQRALAAVLRTFSKDEAETALTELRDEVAFYPSVLDVVNRVEAIRRRGPQVHAGTVAHAVTRNWSLKRARQAIYVPEEQSA